MYKKAKIKRICPTCNGTNWNCKYGWDNRVICTKCDYNTPGYITEEVEIEFLEGDIPES